MKERGGPRTLSTKSGKVRKATDRPQAVATARRLGGTPSPLHRRDVSWRTPGDEGGLSMVVIVISLGITAVLTALLVGSTFKSGSNSSTNVSNAPGVEEATALQAQQTLSTALTAVDTAASSDGYGSLTASELSAANPGISFVTGPSSDPTTVSVAVTGADSGVGGAGGGGSVSADGVLGGGGGGVGGGVGGGGRAVAVGASPWPIGQPVARVGWCGNRPGLPGTEHRPISRAAWRRPSNPPPPQGLCRRRLSDGSREAFLPPDHN